MLCYRKTIEKILIERICSVILSANRRPVSAMLIILHRLHIMPYKMFLEVQVNGSVTLKDPIGPLCVSLNNWLQICWYFNVCVLKNMCQRQKM